MYLGYCQIRYTDIIKVSLLQDTSSSKLIFLSLFRDLHCGQVEPARRNLLGPMLFEPDTQPAGPATQ